MNNKKLRNKNEVVVAWALFPKKKMRSNKIQAVGIDVFFNKKTAAEKQSPSYELKKIAIIQLVE